MNRWGRVFFGYVFGVFAYLCEFMEWNFIFTRTHGSHPITMNHTALVCHVMWCISSFVAHLEGAREREQITNKTKSLMSLNQTFETAILQASACEKLNLNRDASDTEHTPHSNTTCIQHAWQQSIDSKQRVVIGVIERLDKRNVIIITIAHLCDAGLLCGRSNYRKFFEWTIKKNLRCLSTRSVKNHRFTERSLISSSKHEQTLSLHHVEKTREESNDNAIRCRTFTPKRKQKSRATNKVKILFNAKKNVLSLSTHSHRNAVPFIIVACEDGRKVSESAPIRFV